MIARAMAPRRSPARILAPLALLAALGAVILVVAAGDSGGGGERSAGATRTTAGQRGQRARRPRFYVVRPGDILSAIAERTGVSVARIQELNPDVDPQALRAGQRIRLRP